MTFEYVDVVKEAYDADEVNNLLDHGWRLLGFVKSADGMTYVMGRSKSRSTLAYPPLNHDDLPIASKP